LTTQEQENIEAALTITGSQESPISVTDAYTAMEFYLSADSAEDFFELSSASLAHLYFVKVQCRCRPIEYDRMNADEKQIWNKSRMKKIRNFTKKKMIGALVEAVRMHCHLIWAPQLTPSNRGKTKASLTMLIHYVTQTSNAFLAQRLQIPTVARPEFLVVWDSRKFGAI
jgi:hypothetical protein